MRAHAQHYEIGVEPVQTVSRVGIVLGLRARPSDVVHYLVLTFAGRLVMRKQCILTTDRKNVFEHFMFIH